MKILLIGNKETSQDTDAYYGEYADFFRKAIAHSSTNASIEYTMFDDLVISVGDDEFSVFDTKTNKDVSDYQLVLIRGKGFRNLFDVVKTISSYCVYKNIPVINDYSSFRDSSKLMQAVNFYEHQLPVARTVYVTPAVLSGKAQLGFDFPCIMKAVFGAHGNDNYLVDSIEEAREIARNSPDLRFVLQRFVPNDNDYRILVIGDELAVIGREAVEGSHLNNTSQGGAAVLVDPATIPEKVLLDSKKIAKKLGMTFAGVDVLADRETGDYYFLEVNSQPQLMSGAFVEEKAKLIGTFFDSIA